MVKFIQFFNFRLDGCPGKGLIILFFLILLDLVLEILFFQLIFLNSALQFLFQLVALLLIPFIFPKCLIFFLESLGIIQHLFIHNDLSILIKLHGQVLNHLFFFDHFPNIFLLQQPYLLIVAFRQDLILLSLHQHLILQISDDDLEFYLTIIHILSIIGSISSDKNIDKIIMEDFFAEVALQLEVGCGQFACQASLEKVEESQCRLSEQSWLSLTNQCSDGGLNSRSLLKRRPSKSNKKSRKRDSDDRFSQSQIMSRKPGTAVDSKNLDRQLSQLQKTLQYPKKSTLNPRFQRQKVLIKRLNINKENVFAKVKEEKEGFNVTSKFLQEIKEVDEELYEIYLNLYRFYEKEKEENAEIAKEIKEAMKNVDQKAAILSEIRLEISCKSSNIEEEKRKDKQIDLMFMKNIFRKQVAS